MKKTIILSFILATFAGWASAQSPVGQWKTIDDETGKEKSIVEIFEKDGKLFGKVMKLIDPEEENPKCDECEEDDDRYNQPVIGMEIIRDLEQDGEEWEDGTVMDPENGKIYSCKIWLEDEKTLKLRGYIAFFYRTQTWYRVE
ncbi:DUF2147 domain-containing protein [Flammeovirgaceae bacterium SG7u.111]|nr:DUF2147 domain-containing protein [Flammeovirgaceae bacterium SG7u.132]WPO35455.1 DUF2147 domain-containing protein [Flammeovirgaceae bacterium SG7u.111]